MYREEIFTTMNDVKDFCNDDLTRVFKRKKIITTIKVNVTYEKIENRCIDL